MRYKILMFVISVSLLTSYVSRAQDHFSKEDFIRNCGICLDSMILSTDSLNAIITDHPLQYISSSMQSTPDDYVSIANSITNMDYPLADMFILQRHYLAEAIRLSENKQFIISTTLSLANRLNHSSKEKIGRECLRFSGLNDTLQYQSIKLIVNGLIWRDGNILNECLQEGREPELTHPLAEEALSFCENGRNIALKLYGFN